MRVTNSSARFLFDILELLGSSDEPMTLTAIRQALDLPAATAHRGLATLEQTGFAERYQASTRYRLGPNARRLRQAYFARFEIRDRALPLLRRLSVATGEAASLSIRIGWFTVRIAVVAGANALVYGGPVGEVCRLDEGLAGRAMLALLPAGELARFEDYSREGGQRLERAIPGPNMVTRVLMDRDHLPAAAIAIEGPVREKPQPEEWQTVLDQIAKELTPVEHQYRHLDLTSPTLLRLLERAGWRADNKASRRGCSGG